MTPRADRLGIVRRIPAEWLVALAFVAATGWLMRDGRIRFTAADVLIYYHLASAFTAGFLAVMGVVVAELMLRGLPAPPQRMWRRGSYVLAGLAALALFVLVRPPQTLEVIRLLESAALSALGLAGLLGVFLPASGLVSAGGAWRAAGRFAGAWGPLFSYLLCGGVWLLAIRLDTPLVWDPVIFRMDASFGFIPAEAVFAWAVDQRWVEGLSNWGYPLLGTLLATVTAGLFLGGEVAQTRRCVLAILLVGILGLVCYRLVPVISPLFAFNGLFIQPQTEAERAVVDGLRQFAMTGPRQIVGNPTAARNTMPSLHTAFTLVVLAAAWNFRPRFFWSVLPLGLVQIGTTMTLGVHYLVDLIAAVPFAALCWWLADRGVRATPSGAAPLLPLAAQGAELGRRTALFLLAVAGSTGALIAWAVAAPIRPWQAWALAGFCLAAPTWAALRLHARPRPDTAATG